MKTNPGRANFLLRLLLVLFGLAASTTGARAAATIWEAESMSPVGTGATVSTSADTNATNGILEFLNSTAAGQLMTLTTPSIAAGTYQVQFRYKTNTSRGQHTVKFDGTQLGGTIDQYATTSTYLTSTLGTVTFNSTATHTIVLTVTGKDTAATQFYITADIFTLTPQAAPPSFSPGGGNYAGPQIVTVASATSGASMRYTTNGSTPSETAGTIYSSPVNISSSTTLEAMAYKSGLMDSPVTSASYAINSQPVVAAPTFSPVANTYTSAQTVTISSATSGASIRYTTDGSTPSETAGTLYSSAITIGTTTTLNAIAYKSGDTDSAVTTGVYTITLPAQVAAPTFSPVANTYTSAQMVTISSATSGASIRYTTDGSTPSETAGTLYSGALNIATTTTLNAIAYKGGMTDSAVTSGTYTINQPAQVAAPTFSPPAGTYTGTQTVSVSTSTGGASIRYTTNGSTPSETAGTLYSGPVSVTATTTLNAIGYKNGFIDSNVTSARYTISSGGPIVLAAASLSPVGTGATVSTSSDPNATGGLLEFLNATAVGQSMTLTTPSIPAGTYQVQFRYKTNTTRGQHTVKFDGTQLGGIIDQYAKTSTYITATLGNGTFSTTATHTIVLAVTGKNGSSSKYSITADSFTLTLQTLPPPAAPVFSPGTGTFSSAQSVTITSAGSTAIYYTTNGTTPTTASTPYSGPVSIPASMTLEAIGANSGGSSAVTTGFYTITLPPPPAAPVFSPVAGTYTYAPSVTITSTGATAIYYTTNGTTPTTASAVYNGPISISANTTLEAIGVNSGGASPPTSGTYTINLPPPSAPVFSPVAGTYTYAPFVTISSAGATAIYYTTNDTTPTTSSTLYTGPVLIPATETLEAIGTNSGGPSPPSSGTYTINLPPQAAQPTFSPAAGTYTYSPTVTITSATSGASIHYTTDGSTPSATAGTLYSGPVSIGVTTTLAAIASETGYADSPVTTGIYTLNLPAKVTAPVFGPVAGTYASALSVTITSTTVGASIQYTRDGSMPTHANGNLYSGPIAMDGTAVLKAIAYENGVADSAVTTGLYTITSIPANVLNVIHDFTASIDGMSNPYAGLVLGSDGNFYGITGAGGNSYYGSVFKLTPAGSLTSMYSFYYTSGYAAENLIQGSDGNFYGTAGETTINPYVFKLTPAGAITNLTGVNYTPGYYAENLIQGGDGNFYFCSTTAAGDVIYRVTPAGVLTTSVSFNGTTVPGSLMLGKDGNIYGTTALGGSSGDGTVFKLTPAGVLTTLASLSDINAFGPEALVQGSDGNFYGITGGSAVNVNVGVAFKMTPAGALTSLGPSNGANSLMRGRDGNFYGTAGNTVFKMTPAGIFTTLVSFDGANGAFPHVGLVQGSDGNFYGATNSGGTSGSGTIFQLIVPPSVAPPTFSPMAGAYTSAQTVTIATTTSGASIRYTTDGSAPDENYGTVYFGPISINTNTTIEAIAFGTGICDSAVTSATYTINSATPFLTPVFQWITTGQVALSWSSVANATAYSIERQVNNGAFTPIAQVAATSFTDASVPAGSIVYYRVQAETPGGPSLYSNIVNAMDPTGIDLTDGLSYDVDFLLGLNPQGNNSGFLTAYPPGDGPPPPVNQHSPNPPVVTLLTPLQAILSP